MTNSINLPIVVTGRVAILNDNEVVCFNVPKGANPVDMDKKLKGYAWETTIGKSGEHTKTRYYLAEDTDTEIDTKYVKELDGVRYSIKHPKKDERADNADVTKLLSLRGKSAYNNHFRKFFKVMAQGQSLAKDENSRPLDSETKKQALAHYDRLYAEFRRLMLEEKAPAKTKAGVPDIV